MISIPVMTDETVVRYHAHTGTAVDEGADYHVGAAAQEDACEPAAGAVPVSFGMTTGNWVNNTGGNIAVAAAAPMSRSLTATDSAPAYFSVAVPFGNSILDVGPAPAAITAPVDVAPPEMPLLAQYCALALQLRCDKNQDADQNFRSCFHSSRVPSISLWDYVRRFAKYSICSEECFIIAMVLMDRYVGRTRVPITLRNVHRLYITAMTLSVKLRDDAYYSNAYYASIGGVLNGELNVLELELLDTVQWFTWVDRTVYDAYIQRLEALFCSALPQRTTMPPPHWH
ncbi:putative mitochondrial Cyc2-like cyclin [Leptomonas pyrrhocoris]|uniref:Putative mitochondrial Cyc2-like cyclin n=1 Tax=Leptomonas pyrrhocoris TaxID=157538 RepID=A0A0N0DYX3_LEPPY|nr:putative mitochondrial Cyc2-like cyclin [Leptomonas pyrrhocoris]XP_015663030.1 putative mitochondrial Cyc2-like cyclin [Leptomonas pyrrhocoris]KPA84590.1 putative mitochondrial Cyc2-like cyclin [Leptomonas pyrrhocoris]KPA84591.1 putative mitochondrial Cyc2-like cyclin [Leptomonas pyrrhocoris]|eukprot:XP_015663029.1 putative mitochondrial Cyc2-like cyclin [Leptomonas pyrrhocoris]